MKQYINLLSALILGVSIVISAFVIKNAFSNTTSSKVDNVSVPSNSIPILMNKKQLSEYLQISEQSIDNIIKEDDLIKGKSGIYDTYQFLPYLKIDDQERFLKTEVDQWLKYNSGNH